MKMPDSGSLITPTNIVLLLLIIAVFVLIMLVVEVYQRLPTNPLASIPFQASVQNASLEGGLNDERGKGNLFGIRGKDLLRFGGVTTDRNGNYICRTQAVHVFTITLVKGPSFEGVQDQFVIRQNGLILSYQPLPKAGEAFNTTLPLFCLVGDQITFEYYTGTFYGTNDKNRDAFTVLNKLYSKLSVLILPQQYPTAINYDAQTPYLTWK